MRLLRKISTPILGLIASLSLIFILNSEFNKVQKQFETTHLITNYMEDNLQ